jgi:hypothetical protein
MEGSRPVSRSWWAERGECRDEEIDALVYESYGLTEEEIGIVEAQQV